MEEKGIETFLKDLKRSEKRVPQQVNTATRFVRQEHRVAQGVYEWLNWQECCECHTNVSDEERLVELKLLRAVTVSRESLCSEFRELSGLISCHHGQIITSKTCHSDRKSGRHVKILHLSKSRDNTGWYKVKLQFTKTWFSWDSLWTLVAVVYYLKKRLLLSFFTQVTLHCLNVHLCIWEHLLGHLIRLGWHSFQYTIICLKCTL